MHAHCWRAAMPNVEVAAVRDAEVAAVQCSHRACETRRVHVRRLPALPSLALHSLTLLVLTHIGAPAVNAHPLGNMGISHYSELVAGADTIGVRYVLDFAEIPAFLEIQKHRVAIPPSGTAPPSFMQVITAHLAAGLNLLLDQRAIALSAARPCQGQFSAAAAGMHTLRVECEFTAPAPHTAGRYDLHYRDNNYAPRSGWKEIVIRAQTPATLIASSAPAHGRSAALTSYPAALINAPPQMIEARASVQRATGIPQK